MGDIDDALNSPLGIAVALINRHKTKEKLREVQYNNIREQGIANYQPCQIEAFFDDNEPIGNIILSGGEEDVRYRALARNIECAYMQNYFPVVLHAGNYRLENYLVSCFGQGNCLFLNKQFPYYEPFIGLSDSEINHIILNSTTKKYEIKGVGKYYIDGISEYIRYLNISPYLWMYITCPHMDLLDKIDNLLADGMINEKQARVIQSKIVQGELERGNIETYLMELRSEAEYIIAKKYDLDKAISLKTISSANGAVVIDIQNSSSEILINLIMSEIEILQNTGKKVCLCIDGIQIADNDKLIKYLGTCGVNASLCISSADVYADFSGNDNLFYSMAGKSSKIMIGNHISAYSCQKISDIVGSYDKEEINNTYSNHVNYIGNFSYGTASTNSISVRRENIIKSEEISRMHSGEVYLLDNNSKELAHFMVI